ncbi:MAG: hypothetical protein H0X03_04090 [Nitrosopumilus sp.]|nr:hypothetical protein [Nitrosopumilus sp.]
MTSDQQISGKISHVTQRSCLLYFIGMRNKKGIMIKRKKGKKYHEGGFY